MKIIRAQHLGMCFGVKDAIALALQVATQNSLTVLGELAHNQTVLDDLRSHGIVVENDLANVRTKTVMTTAHGISKKRLGEIRAHNLSVIAATCPLVQSAHRSLAKLVKEGCASVVIGKSDHPEVRGLTEDLGSVQIILEAEDVKKMAEQPRFGVIAQTTQPIDKVRRLVQLIRDRFPTSEVRFIDTVCQPTKQRQEAAVILAQNSSVVVVIGGANSNNTHELVETCLRHCARVHHVQTVYDLKTEWFRHDDIVGLTAGTSTPDETVDEIHRHLQLLEPTNTLCKNG